MNFLLGMVTPFAVPLSFATDFSFPLSAASSNGDEAYDSVEAMALESLPGGIVEVTAAYSCFSSKLDAAS